MVAANWYWEQQGLQYDAGRWLVQLLPHRHKLATDLRLALWIILNASSAHIPDEFQPVNRYTAELIELLKNCSDKLLQSIVWYFLAGNYSDFSQAAAVLEWSIALARAAREAPGLGPEFCLLTDGDFVLGISLGAYSHRLAERGEFAQAAPLAREGFNLFQAHGNRYERAGSLGVLGYLALLQGDLVEAHKLLHETVTIAAAVNYQEVLCTWQPLLGLVALYRGETIAARRLLTESLQRCVELKEKPLLARNCTYLAELALWEGLLDEAEQWLAQSLAYHVEPQWITDPRGDAALGRRPRWRRRSSSTCAPPRSSAWPTRRTARSIMRLPGRCARWPTRRWRRYRQRWSRRSLPRRLRPDGSCRRLRHSPPYPRHEEYR